MNNGSGVSLRWQQPAIGPALQIEGEYENEAGTSDALTADK